MFEKNISKEGFGEIYPNVLSNDEEFVYRTLLDSHRSDLIEEFKKFEDRIEYMGKKYTISAHLKRYGYNHYGMSNACMTLGWKNEIPAQE